MMRPAMALLVCALAFGCDDPKKPTGTAKSAAPTATTKTTTAASANGTKPKEMPELVVDNMGPYLGGRRADMSGSTGKEKLAAVVKELPPIEGKPLTLLVDKKAKTSHVALTVQALGAAGSGKITIKTDGRDDLPKQIEVTPETKLANVPACSVAAMVLKDFSTAVWPAKGGVGRRQRKGLAGPDLSLTGDLIEKDLAGCESSIAFFSGDDEVAWELAYNIAGTLMNADKKKKIDTLVLPAEIPVAGRALPFMK